MENLKHINTLIVKYLTKKIKEDMVFSEYFTEELTTQYEDLKQNVVKILYDLIPDLNEQKQKIQSEHF